MSDIVGSGLPTINLDAAPLGEGDVVGNTKPFFKEAKPSDRYKGGSGINQLSQFPAYNFIFNKTKRFWNYDDLIPIDSVIERARRYARPLLGEYVEETDNAAFLKISTKYFEYLFFNQCLYVDYDPEEEEFSLYVECNKEKNEYYDLIEEKTVIIPAPDLLIKDTWNGYDEDRFGPFCELAYMVCYKTKIITTQWTLWNKKIIHTPKDSDQSHFSAIEKQREETLSLSPFVTVDNENGVNFEKLSVTTSEEIYVAIKALNMEADRELAQLAIVANINDKDERMTTGENYKDIHAVACRQRLVLNQRKLFAAQVLKNWGLELKFAVNGMLNKANVPADVEGNDNQDTGNTTEQPIKK